METPAVGDHGSVRGSTATDIHTISEKDLDWRVNSIQYDESFFINR